MPKRKRHFDKLSAGFRRTATAFIKAAVIEGGDLSKRSLNDLKTLLQQYLDKEDYEKAIAVRDEIERRRKSS